MLRGLDVSAAQGRVDWGCVAGMGCRFAIIKCKQGNDGIDPRFAENVAGAKAAGLLVGAYHFAYPLPKLDPRAQARAFFEASSLGNRAGELPPALDLEWPAP